MKARYLKQAVLDKLSDDVPLNLDRYRGSTSFSELLQDTSLYFETDTEVDESLLEALVEPDDNLYESENCTIVFNGLKGITPYDARDERFWTYLCHTVGMRYARARWPIPEDDEKAVQHIRRHFFAKGGRAIERDNAISRLWWMAYLCSRVRSMSLEDALRVLLYKTDVRAQLIERPTIIQNAEVFSAILETFDESLNADQALFERRINRRFMQEMNAVGGYKLIDILTSDHLRKVVAEVREVASAN